VEGLLVFWKAFSFAGGAGKKILASSTSQAPLLSKGAAVCGAAEETPNLSRQRVGDEGCSAGIRGGELTQMRESFTRLRRPRKVPVASLAGSRRISPWSNLRCRAFGRIFLARCGTAASSETDAPPTQENDKPREGRDGPMRARILALEGVPVRRI